MNLGFSLIVSLFQRWLQFNTVGLLLYCYTKLGVTLFKLLQILGDFKQFEGHHL